jgi:hypothetical protein
VTKRTSERREHVWFGEGFTLSEAKQKIDSFVLADAGLMGTYIGKLEDVVFREEHWWGIICIYGVTRYPTQSPNYFETDWESNLPFDGRAFITIDRMIEFTIEDSTVLFGSHYMKTSEAAFNKAYTILNKYSKGQKLEREEHAWLVNDYISRVDSFDKVKALKVLAILRLHAKYYGYNIVKRKLKADRTPWTDWIITINEPSHSKNYDAFYRTTMREGKECELFTLCPTDSDTALLQLTIFPDEVLHFSWVPCSIRTNHDKKTITIDLLIHVDLDDPSTCITLREMLPFTRQISG